MKRILTGPIYAVSAIALAASIAACGGGGGGGGATPPTTGGGGGPTPVSSTTPGATPSPSAAGQLAVSGVALANAKVTYTCGCNQGAGLISTDANGNYTITSQAPAAPNGSGTYTLQGHNVLVVGYATNSATQAWTLDFVGNSPATDQNIGASDNAAAAAALYLYYEVAYDKTITQSSTNDRTFDWFNYNTVSTWVTHLRNAPDATETKLLNDITALQASGQSLFPYQPNPTWNPTSDGTSSTILSDLSAVHGDQTDGSIPTPCPGPNQCSGAPTP
jgi:hypothetical protein